jgi:glutathione synthase/RimK-type ligase-like ATP-grasp enzyme
MKKLIYIITGNNGFFGQFRKPWITLKIAVFADALRNSGYKVITCEFHQIANGEIDIENSVVFYTFSQKMLIREYIQDVVYALKLKNNILLPSYELLKCHEDKGFQELYRKHLGIAPLKAYYISDICEIDNYDIEYPCVLKTIDGSNGRGVFLAHNKAELLKQIKLATTTLGFFQKLDLLRRKHFRYKKTVKGWPEFDAAKDFHAYKEYVKPTRNMVIQQFIPDLEFDFRVLAVYDHFYITKRHVKDGDFRASGTKLFDFDTGDVQKILNYAQGIHQKVNHPYLSMDIAVSGDKYYLLEYQALHFGNNVIKLSNGFYRIEDGNWTFVKNKSEINQVLAKGLIRYLDHFLSL